MRLCVEVVADYRVCPDLIRNGLTGLTQLSCQFIVWRCSMGEKKPIEDSLGLTILGIEQVFMRPSPPYRIASHHLFRNGQ